MATAVDQAQLLSLSVEGQLGRRMMGPCQETMVNAFLILTEGFQNPPTGRDGVAAVAPGGGSVA